jgi:hypothetical protein
MHVFHGDTNMVGMIGGLETKLIYFRVGQAHGIKYINVLLINT